MEQLIKIISLSCLLATSLVYTFFGYRCFKALISCAGALIFSLLAFFIATKYIPDNFPLCAGIACVSGIIGGILFFKLFKVAAFLYGAASGLALSPIILNYISNPPTWLIWVIPISCALAGGLILLLSHRIILITMTAASGSLYFSFSLLFILIEFEVLKKKILTEPTNVETITFLIVTCTIFICGWLYQFKDGKAKAATT